MLALLLTACSGDRPTADTADTEDGVLTTLREETRADTETPAAEETVPDAEPTLRVPAVSPTPQYMSTAGGEYAVGLCPERFSLDANASAFTRLLTQSGAAVGENGFPLTVTYRDLSADFAYGADEAYILTITESGASIEAQTERGAFYGMTTFCFMLKYNFGYVPVMTVRDAPRNPLRGVIEGFYGKAYTHEFRKELFAFMGENKMNAYIYAPKDDAKHRALWRELYSGEELETLRGYLTRMRENLLHYEKEDGREPSERGND
jgi:hyaluronoglucosaminidase